MSSPPYPSLAIRFVAGDVAVETWAVVDTGFDGHLVVPGSFVTNLPSPEYTRRVRTASGEVVLVPVYAGTIELVAQPGLIDAFILVLGDEYLIGLETINHFAVTFDHGLRVVVDR